MILQAAAGETRGTRDSWSWLPKWSSKAQASACMCVALCVLTYLGMTCTISFDETRFTQRFQGVFKSLQDEQPPLRQILKRAAMPNKTIIITTINAAWAENNSIVDLLLESFRHGIELQVLLKHMIVVAFDQTAYDRCLSIHPHCFQLRTRGIDFSGPKAYNSADYLKMMWRRIEFLQTVLENGYSFIFTDADILWFRNPFPHFLPNEDFQMSADKFNGNSSDINNAPNGGFLYVRASKPTINFYKFWYESRETHPNKHDQDVFYAIKSDKRLIDMGLRVRFLDTKFFVSFCSFRTFKLDTAATIHGNCCNGQKNKARNLRTVLDIWKSYRLNSTQELKWKGPSFCPLYPV